MINLIKNELSKLIHRKILYVFGCVIVGLILLNFLVYFAATKLSVLNDLTSTAIETNLDNYNLKNPSEVDMYVSDKTLVDISKLQKDYKYDDWEYMAIENNLSDSLKCINYATINKDDEELKKCEGERDLLLSKIEDGDWKYFIELNRSEDDEFYNKMLDYRLEKEIPLSYGKMSSLIDEYVGLHAQYEALKNDKTYKDYNEQLNVKDVEKRYKEAEYIIENDVEIPSDYSVNNLLQYEFSSSIFIIIIGIVIIASSIVADEFNKGTIKQLLLRPYTRTKIIISKYITCLIALFILLAFYLLAATIIYGFLEGWSSLSIPVIVYNFNTGKVMELSIWLYILYSTIAILPMYLILLSVAFFVGTLSGSNVVGIAISLVGYIFSSFVGAFANSIKYSIIKIFPPLCWDLSDYLFGGMSRYKHCTFTSSIIVDIVTLLILYVLTIVVFKKKEIKNQ